VCSAGLPSGGATGVAGVETLQLEVDFGAVFDGNALDKTTELLAIEMAKLGYPFAQATPRLTHEAAAQRIDVAFVIEQGPRAYVERIEIHGNTRTRDYVIRREFDIAEGDAYNKTLIDRAERRLKILNYFKTVKISNRPGSAPDHVILDVEAVDQATGDFNVAGGYSTTDGALVEVKVGVVERRPPEDSVKDLSYHSLRYHRFSAGNLVQGMKLLTGN
jgi:outer membrane protein insertion porin family